MKGMLPNASRTSAKRMSENLFARFANMTASWTGTPLSFLLAFAVVLTWGLSGPLFHYSDTWQLVINTGTTIVTFLMVFLIQNTQNRDTKALQIKLAELIVAVNGADNRIAAIEDVSQEELNRAHETIKERARRPEN